MLAASEGATAAGELGCLTEDCLVYIFRDLTLRDAASAGHVCKAWHAIFFTNEELWRGLCRAARAWWPAGALDIASGHGEESSARRLLATRSREEKRGEDLLIKVGGIGTVTAQQDLLSGSQYMRYHTQQHALGQLTTGKQLLSLRYFARCMTRRVVHRGASKRWRSLLATSTATEGQVSRLALGALLVERFSKHGAAAMAGNTAAVGEEADDADAAVHSRLQELAAMAAAHAEIAEGDHPTRLQLVRSACYVLFKGGHGSGSEDGPLIRGDEDDYYNPKNSFLSDVLYSGKGIPITMCTMLAAVCSQLSVTLQPVSFPMTFHLMLEPDETRGPPSAVFIDAFAGGQLRSRAEMITWLRERGYAGPIEDQWFTPCEPAEVWARMFRNLLGQSPSPNAARLMMAQLLLVSAPGQQPHLLQVLLRSVLESRSSTDLAIWLELAEDILSPGGLGPDIVWRSAGPSLRHACDQSEC